MAQIGISRQDLGSAVLVSLQDAGDDLTDGQIKRLAEAVVQVVDANNLRIAAALERAGVQLKPLEQSAETRI